MTKKCGYCSRRHPDYALICECLTPTPFGPLPGVDILRMLGEGGYTPLNDISTWQEHPAIPGDIDFDLMATKSAGVFIKRSQTLFEDADGARNYERSRGKLRRGAYLYLTWVKPLVEQVDFFFSLFPTLESIGELPPVLDFEEWDNAPEPGAARLQLKAAIERAEYHLRRLGWDLTNRPLILYTSPGYWAHFGSADSWWALHCDLWIAHYYVTRPSCPRPWMTWLFWQWSDKGDGIAHGVESKQIDMDWFFDDLVEFERYALPLPGSVPPPEPPPGGEIMQNYQVINSAGVNLRTAPNTSAEIKALWPYAGMLTGTGAVSSVSSLDAWVQVSHPTLGPLWAALIYQGRRYLKTV